MVQENVSLQPYNTFGIAVKARYFVEVKTVEELRSLLLDPRFQTMPKLILGGGSNLLFTQDFEGLVLKISIKGMEKIREDKAHVWIKAMSGEVWHDLVLHTIDQGWGGIENLSLIPGQVGAAPMQNIGAYGVELQLVFESLEAMEIATGAIHTFDSNACGFGYRESVFKRSLKGQYVILSITLKLDKDPKVNTSYGAIQTTLEEMAIAQPTIKTVSEAVIKIRQSKLPDPRELGNAGSFFKNPVIPEAQFQTLQAAYPQVPHYPVGEGEVKVPAGWLIEQCGWKGKVVGNTGSHKAQALVLVNYGDANGQEVYALAMEIQRSVQEKFGITIQPEVNII